MAESRIDKLRSRQAQITAQIKDLEARNRLQQRKDETRMKIIAGALAMQHWTKNPKSDFAKKMFDLVDEYVKPNERRLFEHFGITPAPEDAPSTDQTRSSGFKDEFNQQT